MELVELEVQAERVVLAATAALEDLVVQADLVDQEVLEEQADQADLRALEALVVLAEAEVVAAPEHILMVKVLATAV